jgi:hypothetical protein
MVLSAEVGPPAHASAELGSGEGVRAVVGAQAGDDAVLDMGNEQTAPAAVVSRAAHPDEACGGIVVMF